jgi:3-oxoacyl-[acyl-carrier protein] reductase
MRNVIVTGASRGIGLAVARRLAAANYRVLAVARTSGASQFPLLGVEVGDDLPPGPMLVPCDLGRIDEIPQFVKKLHGIVGPIHALVNNAGIGTDGALALMHNSKIEELLRLNILSPIVLTKYVVRRMMADGGGRIVSISSITAFTGYSGLSVYGATKSALVGFTRSLAREVGSMGITVNAVAPGFVDTELTAGLDESRRKQIARRSALGRLTSTGDVAGAVEFLLSNQADGITGTVLTVDTGTTA